MLKVKYRQSPRKKFFSENKLKENSGRTNRDLPPFPSMVFGDLIFFFKELQMFPLSLIQ